MANESSSDDDTARAAPGSSTTPRSMQMQAENRSERTEETQDRASTLLADKFDKLVDVVTDLQKSQKRGRSAKRRRISSSSSGKFILFTKGPRLTIILGG